MYGLLQRDQGKRTGNGNGARKKNDGWIERAADVFDYRVLGCWVAGGVEVKAFIHSLHR